MTEESQIVAEETESKEVSDPIRLALTWFVLGIAVVLAGFSAADLGSGTQSPSLWLGVVAWPVVVVINGWLLWREASARKENLND